MNVLLHAFVADPLPASVGSLGIAFVYEDAETHRRATAAYEFLLEQLDEKTSLNATWWKTSLLEIPRVAAAAAQAIATSNLIILSVRSDRFPGPALQSWIEGWETAQSESKRLIGLLSADGSSPDHAWDQYLRDLALRKNLSYMPCSTAAIAEAEGRFARIESIEVGGPGTRVTRYIEPYVHGGLNE